jgi:hypothetical protein
MARPKNTLRHRGYLYAQKHAKPSYPGFVILQDGRTTTENVSTRRMQFAEAWRAGYLAAMNDVRRRDS